MDWWITFPRLLFFFFFYLTCQLLVVYQISVSGLHHQVMSTLQSDGGVSESLSWAPGWMCVRCSCATVAVGWATAVLPQHVGPISCHSFLLVFTLLGFLLPALHMFLFHTLTLSNPRLFSKECVCVCVMGFHANLFLEPYILHFKLMMLIVIVGNIYHPKLAKTELKIFHVGFS